MAYFRGDTNLSLSGDVTQEYPLRFCLSSLPSAGWSLTQDCFTRRLRSTSPNSTLSLQSKQERKIRRQSHHRGAVCASILRRVLSAPRSCGFDQQPLKFGSRATDRCHAGLPRAGVLPGAQRQTLCSPRGCQLSGRHPPPQGPERP